MKLTFLPKTTRIIGFMAVLATMAGTTVQQTVQAQTQEGAEIEADVQTAPQVDEKACLAAYAPENIFEDGTAAYAEMEGITLSPEQIKELNRYSVAATETYVRLIKSGVRVVDPDSTVEYVPLVGALEDMPPEIERPIL